MSVFLRWAEGDATTMAMLIPLAPQITLVIGLAWVLDRLLARRPAAARHGVWLCALVATLLGPAVVLAMDRAGISLATIQWESASAALDGRADDDPGRAEPRLLAPPVLAEDPGNGQGITIRSPDPALKTTAEPRRVAAGKPAVSIAAGSRDPRSTEPVAAMSRDARSTEPAATGSGEPFLTRRAGPVSVRRGSPGTAVGATAGLPPPGTSALARAAARSSGVLAGAIFVVWLLGVVVLGTRLIRGMLLLGSLRRSARPIEAEELGRIREQVQSALGIGLLPTILVSPRIAGPVAVGVLRPAVILPEGLPGSIGAEALRDILIHECAHIIRRDPMVGLVQRVVELIYWPHPMVHLLNRRLSRTREEACDDIVLSRGDAVAYACTLLAMAERFESVRRPREALALMNPRWKLEERVAGLLDPRRTPMIRADRRGLIAVALTLVLTTVAGAGVRWGQAPAPAAAGNGDRPGGAQPASGRSAWSIPGMVVDEVGRPVAGAAVRVLRAAEHPEEAISGPDGTFVIRANKPMKEEMDLIASADGGRRQGLGPYRESIDSKVPSAPARIVLEPSRSVTVNVTGPDGKPAAEAGVEVIAGGSSVASGRTDATGRVTLLYPSRAGVQAVVALKPGAGLDYYENYRSWPAVGDALKLPDSISLVLDGALNGRVKAVDASGNPVQGMVLRAGWATKPSKLSGVSLGESRFGWARTDRDGIAAFNWLPANLEGSMAIAAASDRFVVPSYSMADFHIGFPVVPIPLIRTVPLRGKVLQSDGQPAAGILVKAAGTTVDPESLVVEAGRLARTGTDGTYEIMVPAGHTYIVGVEDRNWAAKSQVGITVGDDEPRIVPDFRLSRGTLIRGHFRLGADAHPVAGYAVYLLECGAIVPADPGGDIHRTRETLIRRVDSDAEGRFAFRVGPGVYAMTIMQGEPVDRFERIVKDEDTIDFDIHLVGGETRVTGQVTDPVRPAASPRKTSQALQRAMDLVRRTFGPDHWTVTSDRPYVYYNSERGYWMFTLEAAEIQEENGVRHDGKRLRMRPFAAVWKSGDGKSVQRLTAESATLDLNRPVRPDSTPNTGGLKIERAHIEGDVRFVDDRGTPADPADDLKIGPLTYLDFDDATRQITSESHVDIVDPDQKTSGDGLVIQLRKPDPNGLPASSSAGFGAVEYAVLLKNPRVTLRDVGNSGVFGAAPAGQTATPAKAGAATIAVTSNPTPKEAGATDVRKTSAEPVPLSIQADGRMRVDWPPDRLPDAGGPPAPPPSTLVRFERNVVALRGRTDEQPDQLESDMLRLALVPGPQPARGDKDRPDGMMRIDWPPDRRDVAAGPPAPATPPLFPSERDVVASPRNGEASAPVPGAIVMVLNGKGTWSARALTDSQGRFVLAGPARSVIHAGGSAFYARSPDGSRAGIATLQPDQDNVSIELHEAASISGQVVDDNGQPAASRAVELELYRDGARSPILPELKFTTLTDEKGRYRFMGLTTGIHGNVSLKTHGLPEPDSIWRKTFRVDGPTPLSLPNLIAATPGPQTAVKLRPGEVPGRRPPTVKPIEMPRPATVRAGPSRAEVEALLRAVGRDPVTPTLIDRVIARFHPRLRPPPFDRVRQLATDPEFVRHMDELSQEVLQRPADTIMLLRCAIEYRVGQEDSFMKKSLRGWADSDRAARITIRGKVEEEETRRPIPGARVSSDIHDFTDAGFVATDAQGRFKLDVPPRSTEYLGSMDLKFDLEYVPLWVEANGRASALRFVPLDAGARNEEPDIRMKPETPFYGAVIDPSGRPVASAVVELLTTRAASMTGGPSPGKIVGLDGTFAVLTDAQGRFSFAGLAATNPQPLVNLGVTHPEFQAISWTDLEVAIDPKTSPMLVMEPGCRVSGVVVNRRGDPISGASVRVPGQEFPDEGLTTTLTDRDGRFELRNVKPGRRIILAQSRRLAAAWSLVVTHPDRPVQNQFVLQPGESLTGKVIGPDGKPASGAWVGGSVHIPSDGTVSEELHLDASTLTAEDGSFRLSALPSGELKLRAVDETQELDGEVRVTDLTRDVIITLKELEPPR